MTNEQIRIWRPGYRECADPSCPDRLPEFPRHAHREAEAIEAGAELLPLLNELAPYDGRLILGPEGKEVCLFCGEQRGRHFMVHARDCPWKRARDILGSASPAVSDEPPFRDSAGDDRREIGAVARARALACDVPDWQRVVRVEFSDRGAEFVYDDGRVWMLPGLQPV